MRSLTFACLAFIFSSTLVYGAEGSDLLKSEQVTREEKAEFAISQLKAGHADVTAKIVRELLINLQLELTMDESFASNAAGVYAESPKRLKEYFSSVIKTKNEKTETEQIIDSLVDNTVPKNYAKQLTSYCKRLQSSLEQLKEIQTCAETEELKYGDPIRDLSVDSTDDKTNPKLSEGALDKLSTSLLALATEAQQMPVGDVRGVIALYQLTLAANSAQHYAQGEKLANQSLQHIKAVTNDLPCVQQIRVALAYALLKQEKLEEFRTVRGILLKDKNIQERLLITLARFTEIEGDENGATAIYKRAVDERTKRAISDKPAWLQHYNELLNKQNK